MGQIVGDQGTRLLLKVAQLYHLQGQNQDQIGRQLGVSRSRVSRMLKEARERGLIEITIHHPSRFSLDLERRLESELGLREAIVVNAGGVAHGQVLHAVAGAAADYLLRVLQPGDVLGVSGGESVALTVQVLPVGGIEDVGVVQLGTALSYLGREGTASSAEVALQVAQKLGSMDRLVLIPVPSLLDDEAIRDALLRDTGVRRALALLADCTVALVGIGAPETIPRTADDTISPEQKAVGVHGARPCQRWSPPVTEDQANELRRVGAVGEVCARFFDIAGRPCATALDRRMVAPDLDQLRSMRLVIGVACGKRKAAAILGAVRGGYVKSLVTDDVTASEILALAGSPAIPARGGANEPTKDGDDGWSRADATDPLAGVRRAQEQAPLAHGRRGSPGRGR